MHLLVTGAAGFIGRHVCLSAARHGIRVTATTRTNSAQIEHPCINYLRSDINNLPAVWSAQDIPDVVIHLAARAHHAQQSSEALTLFRRDNRDATLSLGRWAAHIGIRRFIYVSSIGVNGNSTTLGYPFTEKSPTAPIEPYAISKYEAEQGLKDIAAQSGLELCIIRPPLVYGPGAPGNFGKLVNLLHTGAPLPFGKIVNRRSFIYVDNLADALVQCAIHPAAKELFVIRDCTVSTPQLVQTMASAMGKSCRLIGTPLVLLRASFVLSGRSTLINKLIGNLEIDDAYIRSTLAWCPRFSLEEAMERTFFAGSGS